MRMYRILCAWGAGRGAWVGSYYGFLSASIYVRGPFWAGLGFYGWVRVAGGGVIVPVSPCGWRGSTKERVSVESADHSL